MRKNIVMLLCYALNLFILNEKVYTNFVVLLDIVYYKFYLYKIISAIIDKNFILRQDVPYLHLNSDNTKTLQYLNQKTKE